MNWEEFKEKESRVLAHGVLYYDGGGKTFKLKQDDGHRAVWMQNEPYYVFINKCIAIIESKTKPNETK